MTFIFHLIFRLDFEAAWLIYKDRFMKRRVWVLKSWSHTSTEVIMIFAFMLANHSLLLMNSIA